LTAATIWPTFHRSLVPGEQGDYLDPGGVSEGLEPGGVLGGGGPVERLRQFVHRSSFIDDER